MKKIIIILFTIVSFSNNILAEDTLEDTNAEKIALLASTAIANTGESLIKAETTEKLIVKISSILLKQISNKFFTRNYRKGLNQYIAILIENGSFKNALSTKFSRTFKTDVIWIAGDILIESCKEYTLRYSDIEDKYKQPVAWWIDILYTDFKAALNPNKVAGAVDFVIGNGKVLADMANEINEELKTFGTLTWDIKYSQARYRIYGYESDALEEYTKASNVKDRDKVLEDLKIKILGEKVFGDVFSVGHRDVFNSKIEGIKFQAIKHIESFERNKFKALLIMLENNDFEEYQNYSNTFFPEDISAFLTLNYAYFYNKKTISTVKSNTAIFHYAIKMLDWGFALDDDFGILYMGSISNEKVSKYIAYNVISKMISIIDSTTLASRVSAEYDSLLSRKDFAKEVNSRLNLKGYLSTADIENIKYLVEIYPGLSYDILVLNKLGIIQGNVYKTDFRDDDKLTMLELMIMVNRILNYSLDNK